MILITVGTEKFAFNRLMQWIDSLIKQDLIHPEQEEIIIQYGSCTIVPADGVKTYSVLPETEFYSLLKKARVIIAHCGEGTIDLLASLSKPFILVPRSHHFQEHVDEHQVELAQQLVKQGISVAHCPGDLVRFLAEPTVAEIPVTPTDYYAQASLMLEQQFENDSVLEDLIPAYA